MEKAQEIIKHIFDLYSEEEISAREVIKWCDKNAERYRAYVDAFEQYDLYDVLLVIDEYWRYHSNKTKPTVAKILSMLRTNKAKVEVNEPIKMYRCIEEELFRNDIKLGRNAKCLYHHYRRSVDYILYTLLPAKIGSEEYKKLNEEKDVDVRGRLYSIAVENGLFNDFDKVLQQVYSGEV